MRIVHHGYQDTAKLPTQGDNGLILGYLSKVVSIASVCFWWYAVHAGNKCNWQVHIEYGDRYISYFFGFYSVLFLDKLKSFSITVTKLPCFTKTRYHITSETKI